jgi:hypothetical protein
MLKHDEDSAGTLKRRFVRPLGEVAMRLRLLILSAFITILVGSLASRAQAPQKLPPAEKGGKPWEVISFEGGAIAVPRGWREFPSLGRMVLHRQGDGVGVPALDENREPLQTGLTVEKFPNTKESPKEGVQGLLRQLKRNRGLQLVGKEAVEPLKLSDGTEAMLLTVELLKGKDRRSLYMKMAVNDKDGNGWIITGYLVAGKASKIPSPDSELAKWLRAHVTSFCLDKAKLNEDNLKKAQRKP